MTGPENQVELNPGVDDRVNDYDRLFSEDAMPFSPEGIFIKELDERQKSVFAPFEAVLPAMEQDAEDSNYDKLFDPHWKPDSSTLSAAVAGDSSFNRAPTKESKFSAERVLMGVSDHNINSLIEYIDTDAKDLSSKVEAVNSNPTVREALAGYLLGKVPSILSQMPERIIFDTQKKPHTPGYYEGYISSREYSVLLALSMIDGSFKGDGSDEIVHDEYGIAELGQHRSAARKLLGSN